MKVERDKPPINIQLSDHDAKLLATILMNRVSWSSDGDEGVMAEKLHGKLSEIGIREL